jgi:hypothetical protein
MLENTEGTIKMKNREKLTQYCTQVKDNKKHMHNTICCRHHYPQANTNNVNKTSALSMEINKIAGKKIKTIKIL